MENKFYAACLASYNNGILHGEWIDISEDAEEMQEAIAAMLKASPMEDAEEWLTHDWDAYGVFSRLGETSDLNQIAEIAEAVDGVLDAYGLPDDLFTHVLVWLDDVAHVDSWKSHFEDAFAGSWNDAEDYAADLTEQCGDLSGIPDHISNYIDYKSMAHDMTVGGDVDFMCVHSGGLITDYDSMRGREVLALRNL